MTKATNKKKAPRRQSAPSKLSSSSLRPQKSAAQATRTANKTKSVRRAKTKKINWQLSRRYKLSITVKVAQKPKAKKSARQQLKLRRQKKVLVALAFISIGLSGVFFSAWQINSQPVLRVVAPTTPIPTAPSSVNYSLAKSDAVRLEIPDIDVNAPVIIVQRHEDDTMQVPNNLEQIGQYRFAPTPGEIGPAILTGHAGVPGRPAVLWRLRELTPGKRIRITRADGTVATFRVDEVKNVSQDQSFPTDEVYGNTNNAQLRLITCGGSFNYLTRRYSENTVVFASLVL